MKRIFPDEKVYVWADCATIGNRFYNMSKDDSYSVQAAYKTKVEKRPEHTYGWNGVTPDHYLYEHKKDFPFTVELEPTCESQ